MENLIEFIPSTKGLPSDLGQKLQSRREKHKKSEEEWRKARLDYLKAKVMYDALLELSLCDENSRISPSLLVSSSKWSTKVQNALLNGNQTNTNGLSPEIITGLREAMLDLFYERCERYICHWNLPESSDNNRLLKAKQLPILLQTDLEFVQTNLEDYRFEVKQLKQESRMKDLLGKHVKVTNDIIATHALGHVAHLNRLQVDYLSAKQKNLELKMKCQELKVMNMTYTPDANKALAKISHDFKQKIVSHEKTEAQLRGELERYQSLGPNFESIAEKYGNLLQEIQNAKWMLDSIHKSSGNDEQRSAS